MNKVIAFIEKDGDSYSIYLDGNDLTYGVLGEGETIEEAKEDFYNSYDEMKIYYRDIGKQFMDVEFEFIIK